MHEPSPPAHCATVLDADSPPRPRPTPRSLAAELRRRMPVHLFDDSDTEPSGIALYSLSDPADIRHVRYVGQTLAPRRRYFQHVNSARLWLEMEPDDWWIVPPKLRRPYRWIRTLYDEHGRFPLMIVRSWVETPSAAREQERLLIEEYLAAGMTLLNREADADSAQQPLL